MSPLTAGGTEMGDRGDQGHPHSGGGLAAAPTHRGWAPARPTPAGG